MALAPAPFSRLGCLTGTPRSTFCRYNTSTYRTVYVSASTRPLLPRRQLRIHSSSSRSCGSPYDAFRRPGSRQGTASPGLDCAEGTPAYLVSIREREHSRCCLWARKPTWDPCSVRKVYGWRARPAPCWISYPASSRPGLEPARSPEPRRYGNPAGSARGRCASASGIFSTRSRSEVVASAPSWSSWEGSWGGARYSPCPCSRWRSTGCAVPRARGPVAQKRQRRRRQRHLLPSRSLDFPTLLETPLWWEGRRDAIRNFPWPRVEIVSVMVLKWNKFAVLLQKRIGRYILTGDLWHIFICCASCTTCTCPFWKLQKRKTVQSRLRTTVKKILGILILKRT